MLNKVERLPALAEQKMSIRKKRRQWIPIAVTDNQGLRWKVIRPPLLFFTSFPFKREQRQYNLLPTADSCRHLPPAGAKVTCTYKSYRGKRNAQNSLNKTHITKAHTGMDKPMPIRQPFAKSPSFPFISSFSFLSNRMNIIITTHPLKTK